MHSNVLLRKVDIVNWESEAASQAAKEFELDAIPAVRVYGTKGNLLGTVVGNDVEAIQKIIAKEAM